MTGRAHCQRQVAFFFNYFIAAVPYSAGPQLINKLTQSPTRHPKDKTNKNKIQTIVQRNEKLKNRALLKRLRVAARKNPRLLRDPRIIASRNKGEKLRRSKLITGKTNIGDQFVYFRKAWKRTKIRRYDRFKKAKIKLRIGIDGDWRYHQKPAKV